MFGSGHESLTSPLVMPTTRESVDTADESCIQLCRVKALRVLSLGT